jgi:transcriptional regulator with XRE-family HTH domain
MMDSVVLSEFRDQLGKNLAHCRKRADLSQEELSFLASVHRTEISQVERGLRILRADTLVKLASALEVPVEDLLGGISWEPGMYRRGQFSSGSGEASAT